MPAYLSFQLLQDFYMLYTPVALTRFQLNAEPHFLNLLLSALLLSKCRYTCKYVAIRVTFLPSITYTISASKSWYFIH